MKTYLLLFLLGFFLEKIHVATSRFPESPTTPSPVKSEDQVIYVLPRSDRQALVLQNITSTFDEMIVLWKPDSPEHIQKNKEVHFYVNASLVNEVKDTLKESSITYTVLVENTQNLIDQQTYNDTTGLRSSASYYEQYHSLEDIYHWMEQMVGSHPDMLEKINIGKSFENRSLYVLKARNIEPAGSKLFQPGQERGSLEDHLWDPIPRLCPTHTCGADTTLTQSNLTERETGSDSEVVIDPVGVEEELAGPSLASSTSILSGPSPSASQETATSVQDAAPPPSAAHDPVSQEEQGHSSSPTVPLVSSPQAAGPLRRGQRRTELQASRRDVDAGVLNYLARAATDDGEEAFAHSLARYLCPLPREVRLRVRGCIKILIDLCTSPNDPYEVLEFIERRQLSPHNLLRLPRTQQVHGQSGFEAPPLRVPTPQLPPPKINQGQHRTIWQPTTNLPNMPTFPDPVL